MLKMIYSVSGKIKSKNNGYVVVDAYGIGFKIFVSTTTYGKLPEVGTNTDLFTYFHVREDNMSLYGFLEKGELDFFEALISISGIGPKMALGILSAAPVNRLAAAISSGETELLQKSYGIGKKTAERIVIELKDKVGLGGEKGEDIVRLMESDEDVYEALVSLGYSPRQVKAAIAKVDPKLKGVDERLKAALQKVKG